MPSFTHPATLLVLLASPVRLAAQLPATIDAVQASPDRFTTLLDNEDIRVVEYVLQPGERDQWHTHPPKVSYVVTGGMLRIHLEDGSSFVSEEQEGKAEWRDALPRHYAENVGKTPVRIVLVEVKRAASRAAAPAAPASTGEPAPAFAVPAWAYPMPEAGPGPVAVADTVTMLRVPHSTAAYTAAQVRDYFHVPDWHTGMHSPMPPIVAYGRKPAVMACGFCHLPDGVGRPENAMLAGLSPDYMLAQVAAMRARVRRSAWTGSYLPTQLMLTSADSATDDEMLEAVRYFTRQRPRQRTRVTEAVTIPRPVARTGIYFADGSGGTERLGRRIIEMPDNVERHERRDARATYVAYVPRGSVARGRALATSGTGDRSRACSLCHGADLRGTHVAPPIAGRSPSYVLRQLLAFRTGARSTLAGATMQTVAESLDLDAMIAVSAYAGSRRP